MVPSKILSRKWTRFPIQRKECTATVSDNCSPTKQHRRWLVYVHEPYGMHSPYDYTDPEWKEKTKTNYDPTAKRPNRLCDPYGQGGKPLSYNDAERYRIHLHPEWIYDMPPSSKPKVNIPSHMWKDDDDVDDEDTNDTQEKHAIVSSKRQQQQQQQQDAASQPPPPIISAFDHHEFQEVNSLQMSAEEIQRELLNLQQKRIVDPSTTSNRRMQPPPPPTTTTITNVTNAMTNSQSTTSTAFPMSSVAEELQRTFASIPALSSSSNTTKSSGNGNHLTRNTRTNTNTTSDKKVDATKTSSSSSSTTTTQPLPPPLALMRSFQHPDYMSGTRFLHTIASLSQLHAHYPLVLSLERKIIHKQWYVISTIKCGTLVLGGLSTFDFHIATMIDVEVVKPDVQKNLLKPPQ